MAAYEENKEIILRRLRRAEGQLRGIQKMVESDKYCVDILTQFSSVLAAIRKTGLIILNDHVSGCVQEAVKKGEGKEKIDEMMLATERFLKI